MYLKLRSFIQDNKDSLFPQTKDKEWADQIVNVLFSLASNRPSKFGVYHNRAIEEIDELLVHYLDDLFEASKLLDGEGITRLAQTIYLFKTKSFENLWWRIENRIHELAEEEGALDLYNIVNIMRSFSRSQENVMAGSDKLFQHLEPLVLKHLPSADPRDLSHLAYSYSIREVGNPELYQAFNEQILKFVRNNEIFDYQTLFNLQYYLMFTENTDFEIWEHIRDSTVIQEDLLPLVFYRAFKFASFYMKHHFPELDQKEFIDKFYYSERYFNAVQMEEKGLSREMFEMKKFLNQKVLVYPICQMTFNNLFSLNFVFN